MFTNSSRFDFGVSANISTIYICCNVYTYHYYDEHLGRFPSPIAAFDLALNLANIEFFSSLFVCICWAFSVIYYVLRIHYIKRGIALCSRCPQFIKWHLSQIAGDYNEWAEEWTDKHIFCACVFEQSFSSCNDVAIWLEKCV